MQKVFQHAAIFLYLAITLLAFLYTMFRVAPPVAVSKVIFFSYGMMAPYQTFLENNDALVAEGRVKGGAWQPVDLAPYFPYGRGETEVRSFLPTFAWMGDVALHDAYVRFAKRIMHAEEQAGRPLTDFRFSLERWPMSPAGYEFLHRDPFISREFLVQIP